VNINEGCLGCYKADDGDYRCNFNQFNSFCGGLGGKRDVNC
jgi:ubiquitin